MAKILVCDDEIRIRDMIAKYAKHEGFDVALACDGKEALEIYKKSDFDVVILDVMMPNMDGYETLKKMREIKETHCIFLTALGEEYDRVYGFESGAEDYVTKPFSLKELIMRIKVIINRNSKEINDLIKIKGIVVDKVAHKVFVDKKEVIMANKEYELLVYLTSNIDKACTRESIISSIWGYEYDQDDRTLDTHMKLLRKDLGKYSKYITTIRGVGYRFEKEIKS